MEPDRDVKAIGPGFLRDGEPVCGAVYLRDGARVCNLPPGLDRAERDRRMNAFFGIEEPAPPAPSRGLAAAWRKLLGPFGRKP